MKKYFDDRRNRLESSENLTRGAINPEDISRKKSIARGIDKLMAVSLFMIFFGLPLFFTGFSFQGAVFEKQIYFYFWTLLALVAWAAKGVISGELKIRKTPLDIPIVAFWLVYLLATVFSMDKWHSFWGFFGDPSRGLMNVTALIIIYYLILSNFTQKRMQWMVGALVSSSVLISVWSLLLFLGIDVVSDKIKFFIPFSLTGTLSGLRIFIGAMLPLIMLVLFKVDSRKSKTKKIFLCILLLFIPINLFLISILYEKISAIAILIGVGFLLLYILSHVVRPRARLVWVPIVTFVMAMNILMVGNNNFSRINVPLEVSPSTKISWEIAKGSLGENSLLGSGPATYGFDFSAFKPQRFNNNTFFELRFYQASGVFFEAISTIGILGTIAFLVLTIAFINIALYLVSKDKGKNKIYSLSLLSSVLIIMFGSFLMRIEGTILILGGLLGSLAMATMLWESDVEERSVNLSLKASPKFALTLAFIFIVISSGVAALFVYIGKIYVADFYAGASLREADVSENSIKNMLRAINLNDKEGRYYSRTSQEFIVMANREAMKANDEQNINLIKDSINSSIAYGKEGVNRMPKDALSISVLAQVYENSGLFVGGMSDLATETYERILEVEPHNPIAYLKSGQIRLSMASNEKSESTKKELIEKSRDSLKTAVEEKVNLDSSHYYLSLAQSALGEEEKAIASMSDAVSLSPSNLSYLFNLGRLYQDRNSQGDSENAQKIFEYILSINPNESNTNFSLGLLYEEIDEDDKAIEKYEKVIDLIEGDGENEEAIRTQLRKMIDNVRAGISNNRLEEQQVDVRPEEEQAQAEEIDLINAGEPVSNKEQAADSPVPPEAAAGGTNVPAN